MTSKHTSRLASKRVTTCTLAKRWTDESISKEMSEEIMRAERGKVAEERDENNILKCLIFPNRDKSITTFSQQIEATL